MKKFFNIFKRSLTDHTFYKEIAAGMRPLRLRYLFALSCITALIIAIGLTLVLYTTFIPEARTGIENNIPADLVATIKSGELTTNQPNPYIIPLKPEDVTKNHENLLVINTDIPATLEAFADYKTIIFANKTMAITQKDSGEIRALPLKDIPDMTITKETTLQLFNKVAGFAWVLPIVIFLPIALVDFIATLLHVLVAACLLWIIMKITRQSIAFKTAFVASAYAYTVVFIISNVLTFFGIDMPGFLIPNLLTACVAGLFLTRKTIEEAPTE